MIETLHRVQAGLRSIRGAEHLPAILPGLLETLAAELEREVRARLAFEDALHTYLTEAGAQPFAAAAKLRDFLAFEVEREQR